MRTIYLLSFLLLFVSIGSMQAQSPALQDVVYLRDGSILRGVITEQYPDSILKIQIIGENIIAVSVHSIMAITQEEMPQKSMAYKIRDKGFCSTSLVGFNVGTDASEDLAGGVFFEMVNGYQFNPRLQVNISTMLERSELNLFNLSADGRYNFLVSRSTNFIYADIGACFPLLFKANYGSITDIKPGLYFAPGYGLRVNPKRGDLAFILAFGYVIQQYSKIYEDEALETKTTQHFSQNRITIKLGFAF